MSSVKIQQLKNEREALWQQTKAFLERSRNFNTGLVPADAMAEYDKMVGHIKKLDNEIKVLEKQREMERSINGGNDADVDDVALDTFGIEEKVDPTNSRRYANAFLNMLRKTGDHQRVQDALSVGVSEAGGYSVPDEFDKKLVKSLTDYNVVRSIAHTIHTESGNHKIPVTTGIAEARWVDEANPVHETEEAFDQITLGAYKLAAMLRASSEFMHDTVFDVEAYVADAFGLAIGKKEEDSFINGTGIKQPTGLLHDTYGAGVGAVTDKAGKVTFDDIYRLYYSLPAPYRKNAAFLCNEDLLMQLMLLKDGDGNYIWHPSVDVGEPDNILGKPIYVSPHMPELAGGNKVMLFGDFSYYWIADRGRRSFRRLDERFALADQVGFMATERLDARLILPEAMKCLKVKE